MKMKSLITVVFVGFMAQPEILAMAAKVESIEYKSTSAGGEVIIQADQEVQFDSETQKQDRQVIVNLQDVELSGQANRKIDASTQGGPALQISPYAVDGVEKQVRLVIQLRQNVTPEIFRDGKKIRVLLPASKSTTAQNIGEKNLDTFMESLETKKFSGSPVTIQVREADLSDVLRLIADTSGFNILVGEGVEGKVSLSLVDVPWDQALEVILSSKRLGAERKNNILRIATLANLATEKEEELRAKQASEKAAPRLTRIFPISYADTPTLQTMIQTFSASAKGGAPGSIPATVQVDQRTNSLIVQDTATGLDRVAKLLSLLDTETPQVLIEAKVIEATESFTKDLSGSLGFQNLNSAQSGGFLSFNGAATNAGLTGIAPGAGSGNQFGLSPSFAFLPNMSRINALISINEGSNDTRVIASPKTVVLNKKTASILQGSPTIVKLTQTTQQGSLQTEQVFQANLTLNVTPTVTNTGSVLLTLDISRDTIDTGLVAPRNLKTEVLVDSGSTLVIGGVYTSTRNQAESGLPALKDIPILGAFFGSKNSSEKKSELLIFVTPRIVNERASGIATGPELKPVRVEEKKTQYKKPAEEKDGDPGADEPQEDDEEEEPPLG